MADSLHYFDEPRFEDVVILTLIESRANEIERIDNISLHSSILAQCGFFEAQAGDKNKNKRRRIDEGRARLAFFERIEYFEKMGGVVHKGRRHSYVIGGGCQLKSSQEGECFLM